jgi:DNA topoisomerase-3
MDIAPPDASGQGGRAKRRGPGRSGSKGGRRGSGTTTAKTGGDATVGECPLCGSAVVERPKSYSCSQASCDLVVWKTVAKKRIGIRATRALLTKGQTSVLKGFKSKRGKSFDARLVLKGGKVEMEFDS